MERVSAHVLWNVYLPNVVAFHIPLSRYISRVTCNCNSSELGRSKFIVPTESRLVVSYLTSIVSNISRHFRDDIKTFFHRSNGDD